MEFADHLLGKKCRKRPLALVFKAMDKRLNARIGIRKWSEYSKRPLVVSNKRAARAFKTQRRTQSLASATLKREEGVKKTLEEFSILHIRKQ